MGVMTREINNLKGKKQVLRSRRADDMARESEEQAKRYIESENTTQGYLKQLYFGIDQLIKISIEQDEKIREITANMQFLLDSRNTAPGTPVQRVEGNYLETQDIEETSSVTEEQEVVSTPAYLKVRKKKTVKRNSAISLARAFNMIEKYKSERGRILWSQAPNPNKLVFAYLRKAELENIDIESTMAMQAVPEYRRVFQYVVYHIGSWKEIIAEYREQQQQEEEMAI